jgi:hypothetical protein
MRNTSIKRWRPGDLFGEEYLDDAHFFNQADLTESSDHYLNGHIDEFGQFHGSVRVYENDYNDLTIPWPGSKGQRTSCGPFNLVFGYLQGTAKESVVPIEEWAKMNKKLDYLGGIYIYRNGIRVLPYGDHSFDWLEVEKRRNKGAGYYFFLFAECLVQY